MPYKPIIAVLVWSLFSFVPVWGGGFQEVKQGELTQLTTAHGNWNVESGRSSVVAHPGDAARIGIHVFGTNSSLVLTLSEPF